MLSVRRATLADVLGTASLTRDLVLVGSASLGVALLAQVAIVLPWTPVPVTLQTLGVFLFAAALGSRRGALAMLLYLVEGSAGLPFFAGGASGPGVLLGPTGGYLVGFVVAAFWIGWFAERGWDRDPWRSWAVMGLGSLLLFGCGLLQLAAFVPREALLESGLYPFLPGAFLKTAVAATLLPGLWKLLARAGLVPRVRT